MHVCWFHYFWSASIPNKNCVKFLRLICNLSQKSSPHGSDFNQRRHSIMNFSPVICVSPPWGTWGPHVSETASLISLKRGWENAHWHQLNWIVSKCRWSTNFPQQYYHNFKTLWTYVGHGRLIPRLADFSLAFLVRACRYLYRHRQYRHIGTFFQYRLSANIFSDDIADICML